MSVLTDLKAAIEAVIFDNDDQLITGEVLQEILKTMCDETFAAMNTVGGNTEIDGNLHVTGTLEVDGVTTLNSNLNVEAPASINGLLEVAGNSELSGAVSCFDDLFVVGRTIIASNVPASASAAGTTGEIAWDTTHFYVCKGTDSWVRCALTTW